MRHAIANLFYALGRSIDRPVRRDDPVHGDLGDEMRWGEGDSTSADMSIHMRRSVPIAGHFSNEREYTHATLKIGKGNVLTLFLERESTLRLLGVLEEIERRYRRYGERGWHS